MTWIVIEYSDNVGCVEHWGPFPTELAAQEFRRSKTTRVDGRSKGGFKLEVIELTAPSPVKPRDLRSPHTPV